MHRGLGGAVKVEQPGRVRVVVHPLGQPLRLECLAGEDDGRELEPAGDVGLLYVGGLQRVERRGVWLSTFTCSAASSAWNSSGDRAIDSGTTTSRPP